MCLRIKILICKTATRYSMKYENCPLTCADPQFCHYYQGRLVKSAPHTPLPARDVVSQRPCRAPSSARPSDCMLPHSTNVAINQEYD